MEKLKFLVVEDPNAISIDINNRLKDLGYKVTNIVTSAEKAYESIETDRPDIVLLDLKLRGKTDGFEAATYIFERFEIPVVFLTSRMDADNLGKISKTHAYGFVNKPFSDEELKANCSLAYHRHEEYMEMRKQKDLYLSIVDRHSVQDFLFVRADYRLNKIKFEDIYFIEALKDYVVINTGDNVYTTHATMKEMMRVLPTRDFVRVHRSFITRIDKIWSIKYPDLVVEGKMKILPIGGLYRKDLYRRLNIL
jgi:two-component system, LytTR family, response regulator LytT